jgi:hypothetical protein
MRIRPAYDRQSTFAGFSVWIPEAGESGEWSIPTSYKEAVLARRRAEEDRKTNPLPTKKERRHA